MIIDVLSSLQFSYLNNIGKYKQIKFENIFKKAKSDTIFIFGSGTSINNLNNTEIDFFKKHDTVAFSWFLHNSNIKLDYYIIKSIQSPPNLLNKKERQKEYKLYSPEKYLIQDPLIWGSMYNFSKDNVLLVMADTCISIAIRIKRHRLTEIYFKKNST